MGTDDRIEQPERPGELPPYAFVPGGPWPHPTRSPRGHSFARGKESAPPIVGEEWEQSETYLRGCDLFNAGYYWEAHESWEALWHAHGRRGPIADVLKGLIKLAAAGVKVRERQPHGVTTHARRAAALFASARSEGGSRLLGLELGALAEVALRIAEAPPSDPGPMEARVTRVFAFRIDPREDSTSMIS
jgi:hypothetical protein